LNGSGPDGRQGAMQTERSEMYRQRLRRFIEEVSVYPVSCERLTEGRTDMFWLDEVLRGGAKIVQLRDKYSTDRELLEKARYFRRKTLEAGALFVVNDRVDIALLAGADGVHVGQQDLPPREIARLAPDMLIGISCNREEQARQTARLVRELGPVVSYYNIGPLYPTRTKDGLTEFIGPESIRRFSAHLTLPFTVMGGIKTEHIGELVALGVRRIAVVTALTRAADIAAETARWVRSIAEARRKNDE